MAVGFVQAVGTSAGTSGTTLGQAYTTNVTATNLLVACCDWDSTSLTGSVSGVVNGAFTPIPGTLATNVNGFRSQIFYKANATAGAETLTLTTSGTTTFRLLDILEYSGLATTSPVDATVANNAAGDPPTGSIVTVADHDLIVAHCIVANSTSNGGVFTGRLNTAGNDTQDLVDMTPAGTQSIAFTANSNTWSSVIAAAFSQTPVGGGSTPGPPLQILRSNIRIGP